MHKQKPMRTKYTPNTPAGSSSSAVIMAPKRKADNDSGIPSGKLKRRQENTPGEDTAMYFNFHPMNNLRFVE